LKKILYIDVFGKTMEKGDNRWISNSYKWQTKIWQTCIKTEFSTLHYLQLKSSISFHMKRTTVKYLNPIYLGLCIL